MAKGFISDWLPVFIALALAGLVVGAHLAVPW
jgi:hypothetical protein